MTPINEAISIDWRGRTALLISHWPPVNALSHAVRDGLVRGMAWIVESDPDAIVLTCQGQTFFAGADILEFGKPFRDPTLDDVQRAFEQSPVPVVAAIHGTALGGGLEIALACHYRVAVESAKVGLPEVNLGLLPGAGGTQRTPRLAGIVASLDLIAGGKPVAARKAQAMGLLDHIVEGDDPLEGAIAFAAQVAGQDGPHPLARERAADMTAVEAHAAAEAWQAAHPAHFRGFRAPANILKAVVAAAELPFEEGLAREAELFAELMASDEASAQRYAFFAERACAKIPGLGKEVRPRAVDKTGVVGAGTMGTGIAIALLQAGFPVILTDKSGDALERAAGRIAATLHRLVERGRADAAVVEGQLAALETASDIASLADCDLVIEAVFERLDLKTAIFRELDATVKSGAILATNTSFLDVDAIAAATARAGDVIGLHFFAPANIMSLLEVVRGKAAAPDVLATAMWLGRRMGKLSVVSGVCDGFIANRVMARRSEAADRLILRGAIPQQVDKVMTDYGFPMGPFQMIDLVGLDVIGWDRENTSGRTVQEILCESGRLGQKSGSGYYDYSCKPPSPSLDAMAAIETIRARAGFEARVWTDAEILHELLDPVVNEAARLVEEDIVYRASDIDMALIAGYGWPVYRGGPAFWGDTVGLAAIVGRLDRRAAAGEEIAVSPLLRTLAGEGKRLVRD